MNFIQKVIEDDFIWVAITSALVGKTKRGSKGFLQINCPLCVENGQARPDTRRRCGIKNNHPGVGFFCFNCNAKGTWAPGMSLSRSMKSLLLGLGVSDIEVKRLNHRAATYRRMIESSPEAQALIPLTFDLEFAAKSLPPNAASFQTWADRDCADPDFIDAVAYLYKRGDDIIDATTYYWTPEKKDNLNRRVIIPFFKGSTIVGWTARAVDDVTKPKYHSDIHADYLFNNHVMDDKNRKYVIVMEGPFDALAIDGIATLGAKLNDRQASWIDSSGIIPIVVADRDKAGIRLIEIAQKRGWWVAFPSMGWWDKDVKDVAQAVERYGRLYTLTSIIKSAESNKLGIEIKKKMMML